MCKFAYDFSTGIPLNILIIYGKDPNFKSHSISVILVITCVSCRYELVYFFDSLDVLLWRVR